MTINSFDRANLKALTSDIEAALAAVATKHGIEIKAAGGKFSPEVATVKFELRTNGADTAKAEKDKIFFGIYAKAFDLEDSDFGKTFNFRGVHYRITGLNPNAPKYPVKAIQVSSGKGYKFNPRDVNLALGR